jgi:hypothetical protein
MSAVFSDFKQAIGIKLSGGNPVPEIERMVMLFGCLANNNLNIAQSLQGLLLLAAMPGKWDSVAQLFMQRTNLAQELTFANVRAAITQEFERANRPIDRSVHKISAVKRKGPHLQYRPQSNQQHSQPGTSRQHQQQGQQQGQAPKKRHNSCQHKEKQERRARKQANDHSHFASTARIEDGVEPPQAPTFINASQPSRIAPHHSSVASFCKNGIEYRKVSLVPPPKPTIINSVWPSLNEAREICDQLAVPKTAKNLKPLEAPKVPAPVKPTADPFDSYRKAKKAVYDMTKPPKPVASTSKGKEKARLVERIWSLFYSDPDLELFDNYEESGYDGAAAPMEDCDPSHDPPVSLGDSETYERRLDRISRLE